LTVCLDISLHNIGKHRALSLDIWLSPNMCVILGKRQFVALLISAWEKYKCLNMKITCECQGSMLDVYLYFVD